MNTQEVIEMIDAITEGRRTKIGWEGANLSDNLQVTATKETLSFSIVDQLFESDDPRTAREIAGALVAWANRKQGLDLTPPPKNDMTPLELKNIGEGTFLAHETFRKKFDV